MGHSTTKMTERYVHPDEAGLLAASEAAAATQGETPRPQIQPDLARPTYTLRENLCRR